MDTLFWVLIILILIIVLWIILAKLGVIRALRKAIFKNEERIRDPIIKRRESLNKGKYLDV